MGTTTGVIKGDTRSLLQLMWDKGFSVSRFSSGFGMLGFGCGVITHIEGVPVSSEVQPLAAYPAP